MTTEENKKLQEEIREALKNSHSTGFSGKSLSCQYC
jgi:uncharacterized protein (UPF0335 family)